MAPYNTQADLYNTGLTKYQTEVVAPYNAQSEAYNRAAEAYNAGPRTSEFTMAMPTAPADYSMAAPITPADYSMAAPTAPTVSAADYEAKGLAARKDVSNRNLALQVMADPEQYGLSINRMFADGGEVEESTASRMLKEVVPMDLRILGSTLMGNKSPITESNFNQEELAAMQQAVDRAAARTGQAQKGSVQYADYPKGEEIGPGYQPVGTTLGRFVYEKSPTGQTVITDKYDFYNEGRKAGARDGYVVGYATAKAELEEQAPVAWMYHDTSGYAQVLESGKHPTFESKPLYAAPVATSQDALDAAAAKGSLGSGNGARWTSTEL